MSWRTMSGSIRNRSRNSPRALLASVAAITRALGSLRNAYQSGLPSTKRKSSLVSGDWRPAYQHVGSIRNLTFLPRSTNERAAENPSGTKPMHSIGLDLPDLCARVAKTDAYFRRPATAWESASLHGSLSFPRASFMQARRLRRFLSAQLCFTSSLHALPVSAIFANLA